MATLKVVKAELAHAHYLADRLRDADRREVLAVSDYSLATVLAESLVQSESAFTAVLGDEPIACFGVALTSLLRKHGRPWLLSSDRIYECRISALKESRKFIESLRAKYSYLSNYVSADNYTSVEWLKWLGFTLYPPVALGKHGELFRLFEMGER